MIESEVTFLPLVIRGDSATEISWLFEAVVLAS